MFSFSSLGLKLLKVFHADVQWTNKTSSVIYPEICYIMLKSSYPFIHSDIFHKTEVIVNLGMNVSSL